jgi:hypothetical protein
MIRNTTITTTLMTVTVGIACVACNSLESGDLRTNGMEPDIVVRSNNTDANSKLNVNIHVGDSLNSFVDLDAPDVMTASVNGGAPTELSESNLLGATGYSMDISTKEPDTEVVVALARGEEDEGAPLSKVTFTEQLVLTSPGAGASFSRANDPIEVTFTSEASEDGVRVNVTGDCIDSIGLDVQAGDTSVTIEAGTIQKKTDSDPEDENDIPDSCAITVSAVRTRTGELDPAYGGGSIRHEFSASAGATSNP